MGLAIASHQHSIRRITITMNIKKGMDVEACRRSKLVVLAVHVLQDTMERASIYIILIRRFIMGCNVVRCL